MATLQTRGFNTGGLVSNFTPVDPRYAVQDPTAMFRGIQGGMGLIRDIEADALLRQDRPRQQLLRDIELAKAQAEMEAAPGRARLKDLELAEAERKFRIGQLEPIEQGKPIREIDASGNIIEYQPTLDFNPATGLPYGPGEKPAVDVSVVETAADRELKQRMNAALAGQRIAYGEAATTRANNPKTTQKTVINAQNQIVDQWFYPDGSEATEPTLRLGPDGQPLIARSTARKGLGLADKFAAVGGNTTTTTGTPAPTTGLKTGGTTTAPAPAKITGTQAPANAVPGIDTPFNLNIPKGSFPTIDAANAAVANGSLQVQPGDIVLIDGVPMKWQQ